MPAWVMTKRRDVLNLKPKRCKSKKEKLIAATALFSTKAFRSCLTDSPAAMSALRYAHRPHFTCVPLRSARGYQRSRKTQAKTKKGFFLINLQEQLPQPSVSTNSVNKIILHINYNQKFHEVQFINFFSFFQAILTQKPF